MQCRPQCSHAKGDGNEPKTDQKAQPKTANDHNRSRSRVFRPQKPAEKEDSQRDPTARSSWEPQADAALAWWPAFYLVLIFAGLRFDDAQHSAGSSQSGHAAPREIPPRVLQCCVLQ